MKSHLRLGAFVTTLNRPHLLRKTLGILQSQSKKPDHVLVIDNGASDDTKNVVADFPVSWTTCHQMTDNIGPAGAAAFGLARLSAQGYDWIYCGDDDDPPATSDTIERLIALAERAPADTGGVGAVGAAFDWASGRMRRLPDEALKGTVEVDVVGGGQQLIVRREAVIKVGLPDSRLFFALDDLEYCLRIRRAGYRLLVDGEMMRECRERFDRLGTNAPRATRPDLPQHALWRQYYSTRNYIHTMRAFDRHDLARKEACRAIARAALSWGRGVQFGSACTVLQTRGIVDGYRGRMGRTVAPVAKYVTPEAPPVERVAAPSV